MDMPSLSGKKNGDKGVNEPKKKKKRKKKRYILKFTIAFAWGGYNYTIDCNNDGTVEATAQTGSYTCSYATPGVYTIRIGGVFPEFYLNNSGDKLKMISINQWGKNKWRSLVASFYGAANMDVKAIDTPDLSQTDSIYSVFRGNTSLKGENANWNWNTSTITNMDSAYKYHIFI